MNSSARTHEKLRNHAHANAVAAWSAWKTLSSSRTALPYFGTVGIRNLGDELLFTAARLSFPDRQLIPVDGRSAVHRSALRRVRSRASTLLVGGGTSLLSEPLRRTLEAGCQLGMRFSTFGTGAEDPRFVGDLPRTRLESWRGLLDSADHLGVRGPRSQEVLSSMGVTRTAVVGDPAVVLALSTEPRSARGRTVGINLGTAWGAVWGHCEEGGIRGAVEGVRHLMRSGWDVRLFSVWPPDTRLLNQVAGAVGLPRSAVIAEYRSPHRFIAQVSHCDVFVGMKLHAQVLAICAGVPTVALEYQPKTSDFLRLVDCARDSLRFDSFVSADLVDAVERLKDERAETQERQWGNCRRAATVFLDYVDRIGGDAEAVGRWARLTPGA